MRLRDLSPLDQNRIMDLIDMLRTMRPMGSKMERRFRQWYLLNLPGASVDPFNNIHVVIPRIDGSDSMVLWSSHTDTVHHKSGWQQVWVGTETLRLMPGSPSNCLGADDTVGVWIMREMIKANVPGHYVFHWGEERGGIGSSALARHAPEWLDNLAYAIAFDRRGKNDVITHQAGGRCCSDNFALSLAQQLPGDYSPCEWGVYTDTAEYTDLIGECTNISVGYQNEHRNTERVYYFHALSVLHHLLNFDEDRLICERAPGEVEWEYVESDRNRDFDKQWEELWADMDRRSAARRLGLSVEDMTEDDWIMARDLGLIQ